EHQSRPWWPHSTTWCAFDRKANEINLQPASSLLSETGTNSAKIDSTPLPMNLPFEPIIEDGVEETEESLDIGEFNLDADDEMAETEELEEEEEDDSGQNKNEDK